jgi:phosphotransacetylase
MLWATRAASILRRIFHGQRAEEELKEEIQTYFDTITERRAAKGLTPEAARRAIRLEYGDWDRLLDDTLVVYTCW